MKLIRLLGKVKLLTLLLLYYHCYYYCFNIIIILLCYFQSLWNLLIQGDYTKSTE